MRQILLALLLAVFPAVNAAQADTLIVDGLQRAQETAASRPLRGMSMSAVATKWGEPATKAAAVGQPPITRWEYSDFVVFFEYDHVIHAVTRRP